MKTILVHIDEAVYRDIRNLITLRKINGERDALTQTCMKIVDAISKEDTEVTLRYREGADPT